MFEFSTSHFSSQILYIFIKILKYINWETDFNFFYLFLFFIFLSSVFWGPHLQHMGVPRLGVQSEL